MLVWYFSIFILCIIVLTGLLNTITFPRLGKTQNHSINPVPKVSILIPARNEEKRIAATIGALLQQTYTNFELIILDDQSTDKTKAVIEGNVRNDPRVKLLDGQPLPTGWLGKNWACAQLAAKASGDLLIFTDADVLWAPKALHSVITLMQTTRAEMLTVWPTQETTTWGERLVVPMMMFVIMGYLPELAVRCLPWRIFAAANGQCLVFNRSVYQHIGGHAVVRNNIVEDVGLAQKVKQHKYKLVMALGNQQVKTRMYSGWVEARDGFAKNILAGHNNSPLFLLFSTLFHWGLFLVPWIWLAAGWLEPGPLYPVVPAVMVMLGFAARLLSAFATHHRPMDALFLPVSVILFTIIASRSLYWHYFLGGPKWKDRQISN